MVTKSPILPTSVVGSYATPSWLFRWHFVQSFYKKMTGIEREPDLRKIGVYGYDSPARYKAVSKIEVPEGLGIIEEFDYLKTQTNLPVKMTCPGPLSLTIHVRPGNI